MYPLGRGRRGTHPALERAPFPLRGVLTLAVLFGIIYAVLRWWPKLGTWINAFSSWFCPVC